MWNWNSPRRISRRSRTKPRRFTPRLENLETRNLLTTVALRPVGGDELAPHVRAALEAASDLDNYTASQLASVTEWVAYIDQDAGTGPLANFISGTGSSLDIGGMDDGFVTIESDVQIGTDVITAIGNLASVDHIFPVIQPNYVTEAHVPNDTLVAEQWHLFNYGQTPGGRPGEDANVFPVFDRYTGDGVTIAIVDDSLQGDHPDLAANYRADLSVDFRDTDADPSPVNADDEHGTAVAGIAAAVGMNGIGVSGAAPNAELAGVRLIGGGASSLDFRTALSHRPQDIDISNNSWGPGDVNSRFPDVNSLMGVEEGALLGRGGAGVVYLFSAGNDGDLGVFADDGTFTSANADANLRQPHNSIYTLNIGAVDHTGKRSTYSTTGTPLIAVAPSNDGFGGLAGIVTTDRTGEDGYNATGAFEPDPDTLADLDYTSTFGGTSAATPLASGIVALMLEANPALSYRDVQHIIVRTARMTDPLNDGWSTNGAGFSVNNEYGFGVIDGEAAVNLSEAWTPVPSAEMLTTDMTTVNRPVPDGGTLETVVNVAAPTGTFSVEQVQLIFNATAEASQTLRVTLTSPDGTESVLVKEHIAVRDGFITDIADYSNWTFSSTHHWGEQASGDWTITVTDSVTGDAQATLDSYELVFVGTTDPVVTPNFVQPLPGNISGFVFDDLDGDGVKEDGEAGLVGHPVFLDTNGNRFPDPGEQTSFTGGGGLYVLDGLAVGDGDMTQVNHSVVAWCSGEVQVVEDLTDAPRTQINFAAFDASGSSCADSVTAPIVGTVTVASTGAPVPNAVVWIDDDGDGLLSVGESFGVTGSDGTYTIPGVPVGTYTLRLSHHPGYPCVTGCDGQSVEVNFVGGISGSTDFTTGFEFDGGGDSPVHGIVDGFHLGQFVSGDPSVDDNDGIFFLTGLAPGATETIGIVAAQPQVSPGYLNAWIDFNGDGDWLDSGEQIFFDERLSDGFNTREIMVPFTASGTGNRARFRWTFERGISPFADAIAGETEDYTIDIPAGPMSGLMAVDDDATVNEDESVEIDVVANDQAGPRGDSFVIEAITSQPAHGVATVADGKILYVPDPDFFGSDTFTYSIIDTVGTRSTATVNITVVAVNDPPIAVDDEFTVRIGSSLNELSVLDNDFDPEGSALMIDSFSPSLGSVSADGDRLLYTPPSNVTSDTTDTFTYVVIDADGATDMATVTVNISAQPLVAFDLEIVDGQGQLINDVTQGGTFTLIVSVRDQRPLAERQGVFSAYLDVLFNSSLVTAGDISFAGSQYIAAQAGSVGVGIIDEVGGIASSEPNPMPLGPAPQLLFSIDFTADNPGLVTFTGDPADVQPLHAVTLFGDMQALPDVLLEFNAASVSIEPLTMAVADTLTFDEDEPDPALRTVSVLQNDIIPTSGLPATIAGVAQPVPTNAGSVTIVGTEIRFDPSSDFAGVATFDYTLRDANGTESTATVTVTVNEINDDPTANDDQFSILRGGTLIPLDVLANDSIAPDSGETLVLPEAASMMTSAGGSFLVANGELFYTPPTVGTPATDTFTYSVSDGRGGTDTATVTINFLDEVAAFDAFLTDLAGNPITGNLSKGEEFLLNVTVEDLQDPAIGIFSAYVDVEYSANVSIDGATIFNLLYGAAQKPGDTTAPGIIDEVGAIHDSAAGPLGGGPLLLFQVPFEAIAAGEAVFGLNDADQPVNATTVELGGQPVELMEDNIRFGSTSATIVNTTGAQPDTANVFEDSVDNMIPVLDNDLGGVTLVAVGTPDRGGTVTIDGDNVLYTPAPDFTGIETFTYTARDGDGNECMALVTVTVAEMNDAPVAVDDVREVPIGSTENLFDLLSNDTDSDTIDMGNLTIVAVEGEAPTATTSQGGTVTIGDGGLFVLYTPAPGFAGTDSFVYTISDLSGATSTANVVVTVASDVVRPIVDYSFEIIAPDGMPVDQLSVGQTFTLNIIAEDVREIPLGVFAAYLDVMWTGSNLVSTNGPLAFNDSLFPNQQSGTINDGLQMIDELGATDGGTLPDLPPFDLCPTTGPCRQLVVSVPMIANGPGMVSFSGDPADVLPIHHTLVLERGSAVPISQVTFNSETVVITGTQLTRTNPANPYDVDANGAVSPLDALLVINELSIGPGSRAVAFPEPLTDVNADGVISPLDALLVINQLSQQTAPRAAMSGAVTSEELDSTGPATLDPVEPVFGGIAGFSVADDDSQPENDLDSIIALFAEDVQSNSS